MATLYLQSTGLSMNVAEPYQPVQYHWFFNQQVDSKDSWQPFSREDSRRLEDAYSQGLSLSASGYFKTYGCNCWKYSLLAQVQMYVLNDNHEIWLVCSGKKWKGWSCSGYRRKTVWRQGTWKKALLCVLGTEAHRGQTMLLVPQRQQRRALHSLQWGAQWIPRGEMHRFSTINLNYNHFST